MSRLPGTAAINVLAKHIFPEYNPHMLQTILQKGKMFTLLCYSVYALSPIYAVLPASDSLPGQRPSPPHHARLGILWLNILVDGFVDEDRIGNSAPGVPHLRTAQDEGIVLIKKKRAVLKKHCFERTPLTATILLSRERELLAQLPGTYEIPLTAIRPYDYGFYSHSAGLSPPLLVS